MRAVYFAELQEILFDEAERQVALSYRPTSSPDGCEHDEIWMMKVRCLASELVVSSIVIVKVVHYDASIGSIILMVESQKHARRSQELWT